MVAPFRTSTASSLDAALERHCAARDAFAKASFRVAAPPFPLPRYEPIAAPAEGADEAALQSLRERADRESAELEDATRRLLEWRAIRQQRAAATTVARMALAQQRQHRQLRRLLAVVIVFGTMPFIGRLAAALLALVVLAALWLYERKERGSLRVRCPGCDTERPTPNGVLQCDGCGITVR